MKAVIIIPTYQEAGSIGTVLDILFTKIFRELPQWTCEVVVVDDCSPDQTADIVKERMLRCPNLHLLSQPAKSGIGSAYMKGFAYAIQHLSADVIIECDADLQHPPHMIVDLLDKIDEGYDFVLASRFMRGGGFARAYSRGRLHMSRWGGFVIRLILFFSSVHFDMVTDPTTGLRATRVKGFLDMIKLDATHLYDKRFGYKIQLLKEMLFKGARYTEIPLMFESRVSGISKCDIRSAYGVLYSAIRSRMRR